MTNSGVIISPNWYDAMQVTWSALPRGELLSSDAPEWAALRLSGMTSQESVALGLTGRLVKYGQSIAISLPMLSADTITRLVVYLHTIRLEAVLGGLRAPWLNPDNITSKGDIILFGRPRAKMQELSRVVHAHPRLLKNDKSESQSPSDGTKGQTWLLDGAGDVMMSLELVDSRTKPFVFVVDGTVAGKGDIRVLDDALSEWFPAVPRVILLSLGQTEQHHQLRTSKGKTHVFVMRIADQQLIKAPLADLHQMAVATVTDKTANGLLASASSKFFDLWRVLPGGKDPVLEQKVAAIGKVLRSLKELVSPLPYLEQVLTRATRPGLYPIRTLRRWLDLSRQGVCAYGDTQGQTDALIGELAEIYDLLLNATTGKAERVLAFIKDALTKQRTLCVLTGSQKEAASLESWLEDRLGLEWRQTICVSPMDGVEAYRRPGVQVDEVVVTAGLWPSRHHWLALPCAKMHFLSYDFEVVALRKQLTLWWDHYGCSSAPQGDKYRLWTLSQGSSRCLDVETIGVPLQLQCQLYPEQGIYPSKRVVAVVPPLIDSEDWLEMLLAEPKEPNELIRLNDPTNQHLIWIELEENESALPWPIAKPVLVLVDQKIEPRLPNDLKPGDQVVLLPYTDERLATQEKLFRLFVDESQGLDQVLNAADRWQVIVDEVGEKYGAKELVTLLREARVSVTEQTVYNWLRHQVYGPRDARAIAVFARLALVKDPQGVAKIIGNAVERIRSTHQQVGMQLRKAILARSAGADAVEIGGLVMEGETFDQMVHIRTVSTIRKPALSSAIQTTPSDSMDRRCNTLTNTQL